ncbi:MAG TPA: heme-binding domain-containing protein [Flavisolibacter sp.]
MLKKILLVLLVLFIIAQFIQPPKNNGAADGPNDITHALNVPANVMGVLRSACYDCHSNHTDYPWYSRITPVNWWLNDHIEEGRHELNFSEFASYDTKKRRKKLEETEELVRKGKMPLSSYTWIHADARLDEQQKSLLADWAAAAAGRHENDD